MDNERLNKLKEINQIVCKKYHKILYKNILSNDFIKLNLSTSYNKNKGASSVKGCSIQKAGNSRSIMNIGYFDEDLYNSINPLFKPLSLERNSTDKIIIWFKIKCIRDSYKKLHDSDIMFYIEVIPFAENYIWYNMSVSEIFADREQDSIYKDIFEWRFSNNIEEVVKDVTLCCQKEIENGRYSS